MSNMNISNMNMSNNTFHVFDRVTKQYSNELNANHMYIIWFTTKTAVYLLMQSTFYKFKYLDDFIIIDD